MHWPVTVLDVLDMLPQPSACSEETARVRALLALGTLLNLYHELAVARNDTGVAGGLSMAASKSGLPVRFVALCPANDSWHEICSML